MDLIIEYINNCLLGKLSKDYHDNDYHPEYQIRNNKIKENFGRLISLLENKDLHIEQSDSASDAVAHLIILYFELLSEGPWNTEDTKHEERSEKLAQILTNMHNINLNEILQHDLFDSQTIFDMCIMELHKKMTMENFRKYPSLIVVYCMLVKNVKNYKIKLNPVTVLPVALFLIEDYITGNKIKGLQSCSVLLECMTAEDFATGNYYEVVYSSLKKNIVEKDKKVTQALFQCILEFINIVPPGIKKNKLDDIYSSVVDQLYTESNLYRKADCLKFITKIIEIHGIHCVKKKIFKDIICDNMEICSNESVYEVLILHVLECLETWTRHCWCVWKLSSDHKMLSSLFKILYLAKEETMKQKIQNLILTLIKLCPTEEQNGILGKLEIPLKCSNQDFLTRLSIIKKNINI